MEKLIIGKAYEFTYLTYDDKKTAIKGYFLGKTFLTKQRRKDYVKGRSIEQKFHQVSDKDTPVLLSLDLKHEVFIVGENIHFKCLENISPIPSDILSATISHCENLNYATEIVLRKELETSVIDRIINNVKSSTYENSFCDFIYLDLIYLSENQETGYIIDDFIVDYSKSRNTIDINFLVKSFDVYKKKDGLFFNNIKENIDITTLGFNIGQNLLYEIPIDIIGDNIKEVLCLLFSNGFSPYYIKNKNNTINNDRFEKYRETY